MGRPLEVLRQEVEEALAGISREELAARPAEDKWSATQVLEHLTLSYRGTTKGLQRCLDAGRPSGGRRTMKNRLFQLTVTGFGYIPEGRKAPAMIVPQGTLTPDNAVAGILDALAEMSKTIDTATEKFGTSMIVMDHPVLGPLNMRQWPKFHLVHGRLHLKQVARIRKKHVAPSS